MHLNMSLGKFVAILPRPHFFVVGGGRVRVCLGVGGGGGGGH